MTTHIYKAVGSGINTQTHTHAHGLVLPILKDISEPILHMWFEDDISLTSKFLTVFLASRTVVSSRPMCGLLSPQLSGSGFQCGFRDSELQKPHTVSFHLWDLYIFHSTFFWGHKITHAAKSTGVRKGEKEMK